MCVGNRFNEIVQQRPGSTQLRDLAFKVLTPFGRLVDPLDLQVLKEGLRRSDGIANEREKTYRFLGVRSDSKGFTNDDINLVDETIKARRLLYE
ncbi:MAG: hypothetical protein JSU63_01895 [Phycisphaerales bacterium]|nr:MAG: hypothetical protein JSU63_01895 [Phycisphaerales bacterium]